MLEDNQLYAHRPEWADVKPIPLQEPENAPARIAYTDEYKDAMAYLRAVMSTQEMSERALDITEDVIAMNPGHYTAWLYRVDIIDALKPKRSLAEEVAWLDTTAKYMLKNYQIWHHRETIVRKQAEEYKTTDEDKSKIVQHELDFVESVLADDSKNYHAWTYRCFVVRHFNHWENELEFTDKLLTQDVRNNSSWNHRFTTLFRKSPDDTCSVSEDVVYQEIEYVRSALEKAPQNPSPWSYIRGVVIELKVPLNTLHSLYTPYVHLDNDIVHDISSTHALELLADIYADQGQKVKAHDAYKLLADKYDTLRRGFWDWRAESTKESL